MSAARYAKISDFCETGSGTTPSRQKAERYYGGNIPWVKSGELREGEITKTEESVTDAALKETSLKIVPAGALLVAMYGATVGRVGRLGIEASTNQAVCHIVPDPTLADERYMFHALCAKASELVAKGVGGAQPNISQGTIKETIIYLPPLDEQKRIAAILDQAGELGRKRQRAIDRLNQLGQAIFHEMFVNGKKNWPEKPLADVVSPGTIVTYGIVQAGEEFPGGVPYIRTGDIKNGEVVIGGLRHTDPSIAAKFERSRVRAGEIVMSIRATVGTVAFVPDELDGANLTQGTARISPGPQVKPWYLIEYIRSPSIQSWIEQQVKGATFREITLTRLRELMVVLPPESLQAQFSEAMADIFAQRTLAANALHESDTLFAALQHRAFRGEL